MVILKGVSKVNVKGQVLGDLVLANLTGNLDIFLEAGSGGGGGGDLMHFSLRGVGCY